MIDQAIIDYIKAQQAAGVARERITLDLQQEGGWTPEQIEEAFEKARSGQPADPTVWNRVIPINNWVTVVISVGIMIFINVPLVESSPLPETAQWMFDMMLLTLVLYSVFVILENFVLRHYLKAVTKSKLDPWIVVLVILRNITIVLCVIPFIQFLGLMILVYAGLPLLIVYIGLVVQRFRSRATNGNESVLANPAG